MNSLIEVLSHFAEIQPNTLLAADSEHSMSYAQGWENAKIVASRLNELGVKRGESILVQSNQRIEYISVYLGCILHGAVFVPVEDNAAEERIEEIATEAECKLYVNSHAENAVAYDDLLVPSNYPYEIAFPSKEGIAEILYTTGTTGKSKGIAITNEANGSVLKFRTIW